jgi:hypothetical protein
MPENFQLHFILHPIHAYQSLLQLNSYYENHRVPALISVIMLKLHLLEDKIVLNDMYIQFTCYVYMFHFKCTPKLNYLHFSPPL